MATRLYKVTTPKGIRLVDASNRSSALSFVAKAEISVEIAATKEVASLIAQGIAVEIAAESKAVEAPAT